MSSAKLEALTPENRQLIFIDQQPQMAFGVQSIDRQALKNNTVGMAKAARIFDIPTTNTTVETDSFSGPTFPVLLSVFPQRPVLERTSMNSWEDQKVRDALAANKRKQIVVSGLWTAVCNLTYSLSAMKDTDYEIYMVSDASGGTSVEAHERAMDRMIQAGVVPVTWQQVLLEWQRDWARKDTYDAVIGLVQEHSRAYGTSVMPECSLRHGTNHLGSTTFVITKESQNQIKGCKGRSGSTWHTTLNRLCNTTRVTRLLTNISFFTNGVFS